VPRGIGSLRPVGVQGGGAWLGWPGGFLMNAKSWKQRARQLTAQTYALYLAYRHPKTPWYAKVFAALVVGYVFRPIDPIPAYIPGMGLQDEMVVVPIRALIAAKLIPRDVLDECKEKAREVEKGEKPVSRVPPSNPPS
jgi:uncharacterized membrane protein YkvA (DUF1232 family)